MLLFYIFQEFSGLIYLRNSFRFCVINIVTHDTRVEEEKANPRCLWKMYQETCRGLRANIAVLVEQSYQRMLEDEQESMGWNA